MVKCKHCRVELGTSTRWTVLPRVVGVDTPNKHPWLHKYADNDYPLRPTDRPEQGIRQSLGPYCRNCAKTLALGRGHI